MTVAGVVLGLLAPALALAEPKHPHLHSALFEMREAHKELKEAKHDFGGHREKAVEALNAAIKQLEKALESVGDPFKGFTPKKTVYEGYKNYPHLRHALHEMRAAHKQLKEAGDNFGGHKKKAIEDLDIAIRQVEKCIENSK
jgi:L-lactate utilization protein LutB